MQKRVMFIAILLLAICNKIVAADGIDQISISDFSLYPGETKEVSVVMTNTDSYVGFQFDLVLPEGITVESFTQSERLPQGTTAQMAQQADGSYRFIAYAQNRLPITGNDGAILTLTLKASDSVVPNSYSGYLRDVKMSTADGGGVVIAEQSFVITVGLTAYEPYAVLTGDTISGMTVTFYYDNKKAERGGIDINNTEIDKTSASPYGTATTAVFDASFDAYRPTSTAYWFQKCESLTAITGIEYLHTDNVTDMSGMFYRCSGLTSLDVSNFNTANVTTMKSMFEGCSSLTSLDLSNFNTTNVTNMRYMFYGCSNLTSLDMSSFNTANVMEMNCMFYGCPNLTSLDLSSFNTANVTAMSWMFHSCSGLTSLDLSSFNTANVTDMNCMFYGCSGLTSLDISSFNTANVTDMHDMFDGCSSLTSLDISNFNTANVTETRMMFIGCSALTTIYVGEGWSTENVTESTFMFYNCPALVGGKGTVYDANHTDAAYAHIDGGISNPGYFTDKNAASVTDASVIWAFDTSASEEATMKPREAFAGSTVTIEGGTEASTAVPSAGDNTGYTFVRFQPAEETTGMNISWTANVASGYTFIPNKISLRMARFGTDYGTVDLYLSNSGGESMTLATGLRPARNNQSQEQDKYGTDEGYTSLFAADIPESFSTSGSLTLTATISGLSTAKQIGFSDIRFLGVVPTSMQDEVCSAPTFSLDGTILTIQTSTPEAQIYYTIDGTDPTRESSLYTQPVELFQNDVVKAIAVRDGWTDSRVSIFTMNLFRAEKPQITVNNNMVSITTTTSGAVIYYTLDGSIPTEASMLYSDPFELPDNCIIKAIAKREGYNTSFVASYNNLKHIAGRWDFNLGLSETTKRNLKEDTSGRWKYDASTDRYAYQTILSNEQLAATVDGNEWIIPESEGLLFYNDYNMEGRVVFVESSEDGAYLLMMGNYGNLTIPEIAAGDSVAITYCTHNKEESRGFEILTDGFVMADGSTSVSSLERNTVKVYNRNGYQSNLTISAHGIEIFCIDKLLLDPEPYAVLSDNNTVLTFYYDKKKEERNGMGVGPFASNYECGWYSYANDITTVVFDASFANCTTLTSTGGWFAYLTNLVTITGIENLNTNNVTNMMGMFTHCSSLTNLDVSGFRTENVTQMDEMFSSCSSLENIDLSSFNTANVTYMQEMFYQCSKLKTITVGEEWSTNAVSYSFRMFEGCTSLVGGKGTSYDAGHIDATYAHIDEGASNPGYFTRSGDKPWVEPNQQVETPYFSWSNNELSISTDTPDADIWYSFGSSELVFEKDWTIATSYPYFRMAVPVDGAGNELGSFDVKDGALVIENNATDKASWDFQPIIADNFTLSKGASYEVEVTYKSTVDGPANIAMGTWEESGSRTVRINLAATDRWTVVKATLKDIPVSTNDAHITFQCGECVGTMKIADVKVTQIATGETTRFVSVTPRMYVKDNGSAIIAEANPDADGIYTVTSVNNPSNAWDTQFCIGAEGVSLTEGQKFYIEFDYKADVAAKATTQTHGPTAGSYITWRCLGDMNFTSGWQTMKKEVFIESDMVGWSYVGFNLNELTTANKYYFKNIALKVSETVEDSTSSLLAKRYTEPITVTQDVVIWSWAQKEGMLMSDTLVLDYPYTAWMDLKDMISIARSVSNEAQKSNKVPEDMLSELLRQSYIAEDMYMERKAKKEDIEDRIDYLHHLINEVTSFLNVVASYKDGVLTVQNATTMAEALEKCGASTVNESITTIVWASSQQLTDNDMKAISNPNVLIYVADASMASVTKNVVVGNDSIGYTAKNIVLTDVTSGNGNFYCPQAFTAEHISYSREFTQQTQVDVCRGWETIALPFSVQNVTHERNGVIAPFGNSASAKHFWLRQLTQNGLQPATQMEANTPYLISMPNNTDLYAADYNQAGLVTFAAKNVTVPVTTQHVTALADSTILLVPTTMRVGRSSDVWALNVGQVRGANLEGSVFERDFREVRPFEAYTVHRSNSPAPRFVPVNDINGGNMTGIDASLVNSEEVNSEKWYDLNGRLLQQKPTKGGVYLLNGKKVVVK